MTKKKLMLLENYINLFIEDKELENKSPKTIEYYAENLNRFWNYLINNLKIENPMIDDFNLENVNEYRRYLKNKNKEVDNPRFKATLKEKISDSSYATYLRAVRVFGNWLYKRDYTNFDIVKYIDLPKESKKSVKILSEKEVITLFNQFDLKTQLGYRNYLITRFAFDYGFRMGSIIRIKKSDIDFTANTLMIWSKGNKYDLYNIDKDIKKKLFDFITKFENDNDYLFTTNDGQPINENTIKKMFIKLKETTGIKELSCHMLRHNFATNYINMGHSVEELKYQLGHSTTAMSEKYLEMSLSAKYLRAEHDSKLLRIQKGKTTSTKKSYLKRKSA